MNNSQTHRTSLSRRLLRLSKKISQFRFLLACDQGFKKYIHVVYCFFVWECISDRIDISNKQFSLTNKKKKKIRKTAVHKIDTQLKAIAINTYSKGRGSNTNIQINIKTTV